VTVTEQQIVAITAAAADGLGKGHRPRHDSAAIESIRQTAEVHGHAPEVSEHVERLDALISNAAS